MPNPAQLTSSPLEMALQSGGVVLGVLVVLAVLSVLSWLVIGAKTVSISRAARKTRLFVARFRSTTQLAELYQHTDSLPASPARDMFRKGYEELQLILNEQRGRGGRPAGDGPAAAPGSDDAAFDNLERVLAQSARNATSRLEHHVPLLASVGSAAPFIGLFGTVWGIMNAFGTIDPAQPILETVTPHIAEALVATAIGLMAAIPAVMAYNALMTRIQRLEVSLSDFGSDFLNTLRRNFFS